MVDFFSREKRGNIMRGSRSKNTRPEMFVRRLLHRLGYRYRLHSKHLPGKPDLAFPKRRKAIFIHGCFWHQHSDPGCSVARRPSSNAEFWQAKFDRNTSRDAKNEMALTENGWSVLIVWECELDQPGLTDRLRCFLGPV